MNTIESKIRFTNSDQLIFNYIQMMDSEYGDELLWHENRWEVFWALTSDKKQVLDFYPFPEHVQVLVIGDKYGALTGALCEKCEAVRSVIFHPAYEKLIRKRYVNRKNLTVVSLESEYWEADEKYSHVLVNLEYFNNYNWHDSFEFDRLVDPAIHSLNADGKLLLIVYGYKYNDVIRLLQKKGFFYYNSYDPMKTGIFLIEASRMPVEVIDMDNHRSPFLENLWFRKHDIPFWTNDIEDQDYALIQEVKKVQIDLLRELVSVCQKYSLKVYPVYGTLLGLMRDGGMIRGDDDIDVAMERADYDKLISLDGAFSGKYFLQTVFNDDCFFGGYTKLRNCETTAIHPQNWWCECCEGIGIDIFPIDPIFSSAKKELKKRKKIRFLQRMLYAKAYGEFRNFKDMPLLKWKAYKYLGKLFTREKMAKDLYSVMSEGDSQSGRAIYCHYKDGDLNFPRYLSENEFAESYEMQYEGVPLQVPSGWNHLLQIFYGDGYLQCLGFLEGKKRHGFYDVNIPYPVYKKRFGGLKYPQTIKEPVVFVGDGSVFSACLKYYKARVQVSHLVQLPGERPMNPVYGIKVESWEEFQNLDLDRGSYRFIICAGDVREAEKILCSYGYEDYYIFWHERDWMLNANQSQVWKEIRNLN